MRAVLVGLVIIIVAGCSGSSNNSGADSDTPSPPDPVLADETSISVLPAPGDQINTVSPNLQIDQNGRQHTVYSNIDGQVIYATCSSECGISNRWIDVTILNADIDSILGYAVPKLQIDQNGTLHLAVVVNQDGGVVFATQRTHYYQCQSECELVANWFGAVVHSHADGHLEEDLENTHWFELTRDRNPKLAFIETTPGLFGDEFLYVISCNQNCTESPNWQNQQVARLNIASKYPASILSTLSGGVRIIYEYQVIASNRSELQYIECVSDCDSTESTWSAPINIQTLSRESFDHNTFAVELIAGDVPYLSLLTNTDGVFDVKVITCVEQCSQASNWVSKSIVGNIDLPPGMEISGRSIDINFDRGSLDIALPIKQNNVSVPTVLARISCTTNCFEGAWSYEQIATTEPIVFDSVGICIFVATGISGPISLAADTAGITMVPHWACSGSPVEVTDADGNVYIDYSSDVRFFEIASVVQI